MYPLIKFIEFFPNMDEKIVINMYHTYGPIIAFDYLLHIQLILVNNNMDIDHKKILKKSNLCNEISECKFNPRKRKYNEM
jgi:hypothetical protein